MTAWSKAAGLAALLLLASCATHARSAAQVYRFKQMEPCPATGQSKGPCPGWQVDHIIPLCAGGDDKLWNMQWLSVDDHRFKTFVDVRECLRKRHQPLLFDTFNQHKEHFWRFRASATVGQQPDARQQQFASARLGPEHKPN